MPQAIDITELLVWRTCFSPAQQIDIVWLLVILTMISPLQHLLRMLDKHFFTDPIIKDSVEIKDVRYY